MRNMRNLMISVVMILCLISSIFVNADNSNIGDKENIKDDLQKLLKKYDCRLLSEEEVKELGFDKATFKDMDKSLDLAGLEKLIIARQADNKAISDAASNSTKTKSRKITEQNGLTTESQSVITSTIRQTITEDFYEDRTYASDNSMEVRIQVAATYTQDVIQLPGEPDEITNKNFISWSQGEVIQTGGEPEHRLTSSYSGVTKYNNTTLKQTYGFTFDNYVGTEVGGVPVYIFVGTTPVNGYLYHGI